MTKILFVAYIAFLSTTVFASAINPTPQKWTYIRIVDYDSLWGENDGPTLNDALGHLPQTTPNNVNYVLLADGYKTPQSAYAYATPASAKNGANRQIFTVPKQPMNSLETYTRFFDWVVANFPAEQYVLSYWGHGGGALFPYGELGYASTFGETGLSVHQFGQAVKYLSAKTGKKTSVVFLCTCLNGTIENAFELKDAAEFLVAGETSVGCALEPFNVLSERQNLTSLQLARQTVAEFDDQGMPGDIVYSAIRLSAMNDLVARVARMASALKAYAQQGKDHQVEILKVATTADNMEVSSPPTLFSAYLDLADLSHKFASQIQDSAIRNASLSVESAVTQNAVVELANYHFNGKNTNLNSRGISIVQSTLNYNVVDTRYYDASNSFSLATGWGAYLQTLNLQ